MNEIVFESAARVHPEENNGKNAADAFLEILLSNQGKWIKYCKKNEPMIYNSIDKEKFETASKCNHCRIPFKDDDIKVRDHGKLELTFFSSFSFRTVIIFSDHFTGRFLGAAHQVGIEKY